VPGHPNAHGANRDPRSQYGGGGADLAAAARGEKCERVDKVDDDVDEHKTSWCIDRIEPQQPRRATR
jgi:hypothetical protein